MDRTPQHMLKCLKDHEAGLVVEHHYEQQPSYVHYLADIRDVLKYANRSNGIVNRRLRRVQVQ